MTTRRASEENHGARLSRALVALPCGTEYLGRALAGPHVTHKVDLGPELVQAEKGELFPLATSPEVVALLLIYFATNP